MELPGAARDTDARSSNAVSSTASRASPRKRDWRERWRYAERRTSSRWPAFGFVSAICPRRTSAFASLPSNADRTGSPPSRHIARVDAVEPRRQSVTLTVHDERHRRRRRHRRAAFRRGLSDDFFVDSDMIRDASPRAVHYWKTNTRTSRHSGISIWISNAPPSPLVDAPAL